MTIASFGSVSMIRVAKVVVVSCAFAKIVIKKASRMILRIKREQIFMFN
jgi:hypothetical protein